MVRVIIRIYFSGLAKTKAGLKGRPYLQSLGVLGDEERCCVDRRNIRQLDDADDHTVLLTSMYRRPTPLSRAVPMALALPRTGSE
jgi:hypothetical protein